MPVVEGQVFLQIALVFGLIGLLGLVLRWTFRRDPPRPSERAAPEASPTTRPEASPTSPPAGPEHPEGGETSVKRSPKRKSKARQKASQVDQTAPGTTSVPAAGSPHVAGGSSSARVSGERADYGLLAVATEVATEEEATKVRRMLTAAGIRNTNAVASDGRHRVLVFGDELIRARRVAGGAQGAGGNAGGAGTN